VLACPSLKGRQPCPDHCNEWSHCRAKHLGVFGSSLGVVGTTGGMDRRVPAAWKVPERPAARRAFRHHNVAGLDGVHDSAAIEYRVRGLERIVVTFGDMALEVFKLPAEIDFDLSPGGYTDDLVGFSPIQVHVLPCVPMCSMNGPRGVTPPIAKRVTWDLASTGRVGKDVPRVPIDAILTANLRVGLVDAPPDLLAGCVTKDRVGVEVSRATRPVGKGGSAMRPQCDQIVAEDPVHLVA